MKRAILLLATVTGAVPKKAVIENKMCGNDMHLIKYDINGCIGACHAITCHSSTLLYWEVF